MGMFAAEKAETEAMAAATERVRENLGTAAAHQERLTRASSAMRKSAGGLLPGTVLDSGGTPTASSFRPMSQGGGGGGASAGAGGGSTFGPIFDPTAWGSTKPMEQWTADDWAAYYEALGGSPRIRSLSPLRMTSSGGSGGGSGGRPTGMDSLGNYNTAAVRGGATPTNLLAAGAPGGGKSSVVSDPGAHALLGRVARAMERLGDRMRDDGGASLRREGVVP